MATILTSSFKITNGKPAWQTAAHTTDAQLGNSQAVMLLEGREGEQREDVHGRQGGHRRREEQSAVIHAIMRGRRTDAELAEAGGGERKYGRRAGGAGGEASQDSGAAFLAQRAHLGP